MDEITIRKVETFDDLHRVYRLAHDSFYEAGLCDYHPQRMMIHHPGQDVIPETSIFLVEKDGVPVGSLSFTSDSYFGLMVDPEFKQQVDRYRKFYGKVASIWRFIVHPAHQNDLRIFRKLIGAGAVCLLKHQIPVCFFTFSPEHARIYERIFHTEEVCRGKDSNVMIKTEHAEVVLMKLYPDKLPEKWFSLAEEEVMI
jgi:hypothetical protein